MRPRLRPGRRRWSLVLAAISPQSAGRGPLRRRDPDRLTAAARYRRRSDRRRSRAESLGDRLARDGAVARGAAPRRRACERATISELGALIMPVSLMLAIAALFVGR